MLVSAVETTLDRTTISLRTDALIANILWVPGKKQDTRLFVETSAMYTADRVSWHNKLNSWNRPTTVTVKILLRCKLCYCIFLYCNLPMSQVSHVQVRRLQNYHARAVVANSLTEPYFVRARIKNVCTIQLACCIGTRGLQMCCFVV